MQEAEVQFLREQNELEINKAKELSNIEVTYNNKIHVLIIITYSNIEVTYNNKIHVLIIITCSNIEVTYNNKIHVLIIITCRYPSLV